jgi:hypothetical protein
MHAERLLLLVDELDELTVALREACTFGGLCTLLIVLVAAATFLRTASVSLALVTFVAGMAALSGVSALRRLSLAALPAGD